MAGLSSSRSSFLSTSVVALPRSSVNFQKASVCIRERCVTSVIMWKEAVTCHWSLPVNLSSGVCLCVCGGDAALLSVSKHLKAEEKHVITNSDFLCISKSDTLYICIQMHLMSLYVKYEIISRKVYMCKYLCVFSLFCCVEGEYKLWKRCGLSWCFCLGALWRPSGNWVHIGSWLSMSWDRVCLCRVCIALKSTRGVCMIIQHQFSVHFSCVPAQADHCWHDLTSLNMFGKIISDITLILNELFWVFIWMFQRIWAKSQC